MNFYDAGIRTRKKIVNGVEKIEVYHIDSQIVRSEHKHLAYCHEPFNLTPPSMETIPMRCSMFIDKDGIIHND